MKLLLSVGLLGSSSWAQSDPTHLIGCRLQSAAEQLFSISFADPAFSSNTMAHGCWCTKLNIENAGLPGLGGLATDDLDQICKDWFKARRCSSLDECADRVFGSSDTYEISESLTCLSTDPCLSSTCNIDLHFINLIENFYNENSGFAPVTNSACEHRVLSNQPNCEPLFSTTTTTTQPGAVDTRVPEDAEEIADEITDILDLAGIEPCVGSDCVMLSLYWNNTQPNGVRSEIDMWVQEPNGEYTGWSRNHYPDNSTTGGYLDYDGGWEEVGAALENIQWPHTAPPGTYRVQVHMYAAEKVDEYRMPVHNCNSTNPCEDVQVNFRIVVDGVTSLFVLNLHTNIDQTWTIDYPYEYPSYDTMPYGNGDPVAEYIMQDVYTFDFNTQLLDRNQAPIVMYTGPGIDYSKKHDWELK